LKELRLTQWIFRRSKNMNTYRYNVTSDFVPYFINGELSDLTDKEERNLELFDRYVQEEHGAGHWSYDDQESKFCYCDVTDVKANCVEMEWVVI
jgi:hypothetical protein